MTPDPPNSADPLSRDDLSYELDWSRLPEDSGRQFRDADPWPHLIIDGLFPGEVIEAAEHEEMPRTMTLKAVRSQRKYRAESDEVSGPSARSLLDHLTSEPMVKFLRETTGIGDLEADSSFYNAGIYGGPPSSFQAVHADFRLHGITRSYHRIKVIVYLNSDWDESLGGQLELWDRGLSACRKRVTPVAGRMVVMGIGPDNYHGVPEALTSSGGRWRLTLATSYYSNTPAPDDRRPPFVRRPRRPEDPWWTGFGDVGGVVIEGRLLVERLWARVSSLRRN
jgi:2-oxoglutarate-Fe(II)-dependent oxygenase superfamily protein